MLEATGQVRQALSKQIWSLGKKRQRPSANSKVELMQSVSGVVRTTEGNGLHTANRSMWTFELEYLGTTLYHERTNDCEHQQLRLYKLHSEGKPLQQDGIHAPMPDIVDLQRAG